jgi:hypothetical protein
VGRYDRGHDQPRLKARGYCHRALCPIKDGQLGYRRLFILLRQDGELSGINRVYRLYREEGLTVRQRRLRRRAVGTRAPIVVEAAANAGFVRVNSRAVSGRASLGA